VEQAVLDPTQEDVYGSRVWFSIPLQQQRVDLDYLRVDNKPLEYRYSYLFDHQTGKYHEITYHNNVATCKSGALSGKLEPACLARNARIRGRVTLGGVLSVDDWVEHEEINKTRLRTSVLVAANIDVPVFALTRDPKTKQYIIDQFWNFQEKVDHEAFRVPSVCTTAQFVREPKTFEQIMFEVNPAYSHSSFWNKRV